MPSKKDCNSNYLADITGSAANFQQQVLHLQYVTTTKGLHKHKQVRWEWLDGELMAVIQAYIKSYCKHYCLCWQLARLRHVRRRCLFCHLTTTWLLPLADRLHLNRFFPRPSRNVLSGAPAYCNRADPVSKVHTETRDNSWRNKRVRENSFHMAGSKQREVDPYVFILPTGSAKLISENAEIIKSSSVKRHC